MVACKHNESWFYKVSQNHQVSHVNFISVSRTFCYMTPHTCWPSAIEWPAEWSQWAVDY